MAFASVNGVLLHYDDRGPRERPTIVFSNSLGTDFRIWDATVAGLGERFRTIRYDKRGHGLSEAPSGPYRMEDHIGDLAALLGHCDVDRAIVVGLSIGGMIAQGLAATRPDLVSALVLCDTGHKIGEAELWNSRIHAVETVGIESIADQIMTRWFSPAYRDPANAAFAGYRNMLTRTPAAGYAGTCAAIRDADFTASTAALTLPTLCVVGDHDGATTVELVRELASLIPGSRFEVIAGAGHLPCLEQPEALVKLIDGFLTENNLG